VTIVGTPDGNLPPVVPTPPTPFQCLKGDARFTLRVARVDAAQAQIHRRRAAVQKVDQLRVGLLTLRLIQKPVVRDVLHPIPFSKPGKDPHAEHIEGGDAQLACRSCLARKRVQRGQAQCCGSL
jgi:hypothetical protein